MNHQSINKNKWTIPFLEYFFTKSKSEWYDVKNELIRVVCCFLSADDVDAADDDDDVDDDVFDDVLDDDTGYNAGGCIWDCIAFRSTVLISFVVVAVAFDVTVNVNDDLLLEQIDDILSWIEWWWWLWWGRWRLWWWWCDDELWQWQHDRVKASRNVSFEINIINGNNNASNNESATNIRSWNGVHNPGINMANKLNT